MDRSNSNALPPIIIYINSFNSKLIDDFEPVGLTGVRSKVRTYQSMLKCYLSTLPCLDELSELDKDEVEAEMLVCVGHICSKTQSSLLQLTKLSRNGKNA